MHRFRVPDMSCGHCVQSITKAVQTVDSTARVETDLSSHEVTVDSHAPTERFQQALDSIGFPSQPLD